MVGSSSFPSKKSKTLEANSNAKEKEKQEPTPTDSTVEKTVSTFSKKFKMPYIEGVTPGQVNDWNKPESWE